MKLFPKLEQHFKIRKLQRQFDRQIHKVQQLMDAGQVTESGQALLEAERLRKAIATLEELPATEQQSDGES